MRGPIRWAQTCGAQNCGEAPSPSLRIADPSYRRSSTQERRPKDAYALPARRGEVNTRQILAARHRARVMPTTTRKKKTEGGEAPKGACHPLSALSQTSVRSLRHSSAARTRAKRGALAFRRFAADCHASRNQHWLSPRPCFLGPGSGGCHPPSPVPVQRAPHRPVILPDQRCPGPPGSGVQIRARAPHPAPLPGLPRESDPRMSGISPPNANGDEMSMKK